MISELKISSVAARWTLGFNFPGRDGVTGRFLSWKLRYKVAVDVARALVYLHHDCWPRILDLDIKPENILLDDDLEAVVSDFSAF
ncbi:hypothetical protein GIB67_029063 [Kingdonia uniflora]|uniref:Protein kinase domain-containing protein n=1 Tax=Kingdonia uniflora TaxID=39325 RepID=A0A7J7N6Y9_9MAGN|nr:hypothetical protein GIB67_029063 [Kingdonia uniflora]